MENQELEQNIDNSVEQLDLNDDTAVSEKISSLMQPEEVFEQPVEEPEEVVEAVKPVVADDTLVTVKINGEEKQVPLAELKNGYQRQSDYTSKTQELSQQRQEVNQQKQQYDQYLQSIPLLAMVAQQNVSTAQDKLYSQDFLNLAESDPAEYVVQKAQLEKTIAENYKAFNMMQNQYAEHNQQVMTAQNQRLIEVVNQSNQILETQLEGWKDGSLKQAIREYALKNEYDDQDLQQLYDHRHVKILNKARLYDELMANQNAGQKRVDRVPPKVITPSTNTIAQSSYNERKEKALRSGNTDDLASLISELL
jgi:hypothetical protein